MRLKRKKHDDEIDNRSIESVAWMGRELRARIEWHYKQQDVNVRVGVYQGRTTANARFASGLEGKVALIGGKGKTRLDRRHHAVDALVIALMNDGVAKTLAERISMREAQRARKDVETWQEYRGATNGAKNTYGAWLNAMNRLTELLNSALENDEIPVMQNVRLRLGSGKAHDDKIRKLVRKRLGDAWSMTEIDRASTPQLWTALTRCEDFEDGVGLPENTERKIRVRGEFFEADDTLGLFDTGSAAIAVRGGYAEIGATIHHARIYRINGKKPSFAMVRVFTVDLLKHRKEDLFSVQLPESSISLRTADPKIKKALKDGTAEYLGWLVAGDEIELDTTAVQFQTGQIGELLAEFPGTTRFVVAGFPEPGRFRLRPRLLAGEGYKTGTHGVEVILNGKGWQPRGGALFSALNLRIIRRNSIGTAIENDSRGRVGSWQVSNQ